MRELIFDTETTGLNAKDDRIIEIGLVELKNLVPTGRTFHRYMNPLRDVNPGAFRVHGISNDFLRDKPYFQEIVGEFLDFIGNDPLVAHNATFDMRFLNEEMRRIGRPALSNQVIDTLPLAREVKKGGTHNLDALCNYFKIDRSKRKKHGALLDAEILAEVYLALKGGRQFGMIIEPSQRKESETVEVKREQRAFVSLLTGAEKAAHDAFIAEIGNSIWGSYKAGTSEQLLR